MSQVMTLQPKLGGANLSPLVVLLLLVLALGDVLVPDVSVTRSLGLAAVHTGVVLSGIYGKLSS